jgi:WW domain-binding protein 4
VFSNSPIILFPVIQLAQASHAKDLASGSQLNTAKSPGDAETSEGKAKSKQEEPKSGKTTVAWKPTNRLATYGSALPINDGSLLAEAEEQKFKEWQELREAQSKEGTAGEWQTVAPVMSKEEEEDLKFATAPRPDPYQPHSYVVREKQGRFQHDDDENDGPEIKVKKRIKVQSETERLKQVEEEKKQMLPTWKPMRLDTGVSVKEERVQAVPIERRETQEVDLAEEEDAATAAVETKVETAVLAQTEAPLMFKKRKAGAGAGAKRVRAVI